MASRFRTIIDKICGIDDRFEMLNERLTLIEETIGINSFMADGKIVTADGTVGVGSTVPPDVARYEELKAKTGNVGVGSTAPAPAPAPAPDGNVGVGNVGVGNVGVGNVGVGNVGAGSTAPAGTTETEPDTAVDGGQSDPAPGAGNVGVGSTAPDPDFS